MIGRILKMSYSVESFESWDPLESTAGVDPGILISAQRREIANILRSYTGYYDLFAELLQNSLDAVEKRLADEKGGFKGRIRIKIDLRSHSVEVTDNGCGMDLMQLRQFLRPNFSFKSGAMTRGSKGVEQDHRLAIKGAGLFMPTEELPIRSEPLVEQDVVALFNQMLSSGLVRGVQLIASSQFNQYDGLYRVRMEPPFDKYIRSDKNPLGIDAEFFSKEEPLVTKVKVLEYKYNLDGLIEELQSGVKDVNDIGLAVAWEMGTKWREMFDVTCLLDDDSTHHRQIHGTTHSFTHSVSGAHAFEAIILHDLVRYLRNPQQEIERQRAVLNVDA